MASETATPDPAATTGTAVDEAAAPDTAGRRPTTRTFTDPRDILLAPVISEKSYGLLDENKYTFLVDRGANKTQIRIAVEQVFGVKVDGVNTLNREGKRKRTRTGYGRRVATKRAIVTVAAGDRIDIFGGPVS